MDTVMYDVRGDARCPVNSHRWRFDEMRRDLDPYSTLSLKKFNFMTLVSSLEGDNNDQTFSTPNRNEKPKKIGRSPPYRLLAVTLFATPPRSEAPRTSL